MLEKTNEEIKAEIEKKTMYMLSKLNMPIDAVRKSLVDQNYNPDDIVEVLTRIQSSGAKFTSSSERDAKKAAKKTLYSGIAVTIFGIIVSLASYLLSEAIGASRFRISLGLIVFGVVLIIKGAIQLGNSSHE